MTIKRKVNILKQYRMNMIYLKKISLLMIDLYRKYISRSTFEHCKYIPTCSIYAKNMIDKYNIFFAFCFIFIRLIKCNQYSKNKIELNVFFFKFIQERKNKYRII